MNQEQIKLEKELQEIALDINNAYVSMSSAKFACDVQKKMLERRQKEYKNYETELKSLKRKRDRLNRKLQKLKKK